MLVVQEAFSEFFLYDTEGTIAVSTNPVQVGKVVRQKPYFEPSLQGVQIQTPFYELQSENLTVVASRPVFNDAGQLVGVLAGRLSPGTFATIMTQRVGLGETGETYLVSLENNYLVTPSRFEGYPLLRAYRSEGIDNALAGNGGTASYTNYREQPVIGAYRWLPDLQVGLVAEMDQAEAFGGVRQATQASILVATLAAFVAASIGLIIALRITRPITELTRVTRELSEGNLAARTHITLRNEIGELGSGFNTMAAQLQTTLQRLEESVKEARTATAMAREANRVKSEFLATMSHELRTPLNAIIGFAEILLAGMVGELSEKHKHKITRIHLNSKRLLDLINDLLDLAKIEAGRVEVLREQFSPVQLAATLEAEMESLAEQKGLTFNVSVDSSLPPTLIGDPARIEQATSNLLSNAFKFTHHGNVTLKLSANGDRSWSVGVVDSGIGIPPHALEYIFDEFRQVDTGSQRAYGGSGLGLAITRNLARVMGGEVHVSSTLGEGSTFTITLPLVVPQDVPAEMAL
jgi:signal transduction histidine kinase